MIKCGVLFLRNLKANYEEENSDLVKSFIKIQDLQECYEVWAPYSYRGITGFVDLIIETGNGISIFKFLKNAKKLEQTVRSLKLEGMFYPKSQGLEEDNVDTYLVIQDNRRNRKAVFYQYTLLGNQPFEILFINATEETIESVAEMKENIPKLFQTRKKSLEKDALRKLISKPNHEKVERAILGCENSPEVVTEELVERMDKYLKRNETAPEDLTSLEKDFDKGKTDNINESCNKKEIEDTETPKVTE